MRFFTILTILLTFTIDALAAPSPTPVEDGTAMAPAMNTADIWYNLNNFYCGWYLTSHKDTFPFSSPKPNPNPILHYPFPPSLNFSHPQKEKDSSNSMMDTMLGPLRIVLENLTVGSWWIYVREETLEEDETEEVDGNSSHCFVFMANTKIAASDLKKGGFS
ncbi:hypothetical protein B0J14DRAFT_569237 [Halenospora varia]|nr:hypothetical protein B0J14DRAFT_569237 [Halenospora varia]